MNKFKYYFILLITTVSLFSCSKDNNTAEIVPPRDYAVQYATDLADIEELTAEQAADFIMAARNICWFSEE